MKTSARTAEANFRPLTSRGGAGRRWCEGAVWLLACGLAGQASLRAQSYSFTDLGFPGNIPGSASEAHAINHAGVTVGTWWNGSSSRGSQYAFLYTNGAISDLGTIKSGGYDYAIANAVNDAGTVVGQGTSSGGGGYTYHAFVYTNGLMVDLDKTGQSWSSANAINQRGQIVGELTTPLGFIHAFLYTNNAMLDLGTLPGGTYSSAKGINDAGVIVGEAADASGNTLAFIYTNGVMASLGTLGGTYSSAKAINNAGVIVGESQASNGETHAFVCQTGAMLDLGTFGGTNSTATAIANSGLVVGWALNTNQDGHAFVYDGSRMLDLHKAFVPPASWTNLSLTLAYGVNDLGQVAGAIQYLSNGVSFYDGFLASPPALALSPLTNLNVTATAPGGAVVNFSPVARGGCSTPLLQSIPPSGSLFPVGTNTVLVLASDLCGHTNTASFTITVARPLSPLAQEASGLSPNGQFQVRLRGLSGQRFAMLVSSNLVDWVPCATNYLSSNTFDFVASLPSTNRTSFYRALVLP